MAMLLVLIAVAMATILSMSFLSSQATSLGVAKNVQGHAQARSVAESALVVAINYVQTDTSWRTDKTEGQWVSNVSFNGGTFDLYGYDGLDTDGDGVVDDTDGDLADDPSDPVTLKVVADVDGVSHTVFAVVTVGSGSITKRVLMIVADAGNLDPKESGRQGMIEGWGWAVDILDDGASQAEYDTAVGLVDGVLVPGTVNASTVGTKLNSASVGVVIEEGGLADDLKISSSFGSYTGTSVNVVNSSHYITSAFGSGLVAVSNTDGTMGHPAGTLASGGQSLAESPDGSVSAVVALEPGAALYGGGIAAGRRVSIPTGDFLVTDLTADGEELIKRALTWSGGGDADSFISGQWALDEASGLIAYDSSGNGQNGPITAGDPSTQWTAGKVFGGLRFDGSGDGFVRIPDSDVLDLAEAGTLSAWIYLDGYSNFMGIIHKGENKNWSDEAYSLQFWTSRRIAMSFTTSSGGKLIVGSQQLQDGQWYHVVGTWGTNGMAIYINGVLDASNSTTAVGVASIGSVQIGAQLSEDYNSSYKNFPFNGVIDDARIYKRTLTAAEVADAYNQAITSSDTPQLIALYEFQEVVPPPPALVGHWLLDDLTGATVADDAAGNNGSTSGGVTAEVTGNGDGGTAFQFDGVNGYVQVAHDDAYLLNDGAVSFWFKPDDLVGHHAMFSKDSTNFDTGGHLHIYTEGAILKARLQSTSADYTVQSSGLSVGNWYQVTVSFGSGGLRLYRDGVLVDSDSYTGGLGSNSGGIGNHEPMAIGAGTWTSDDLAITPITYPFVGSIDDVRIYDRGFDDTQALDLYNGNTPGSGPATVVYDTSGFGAPLNLNIETPGNVSWLAGGGLQFDTATKVVSPTAATKLYSALTATDQITLEIVFTPTDTNQNGPARIVTYSGGSSSRNFTFGQEDDTYITRLRTDTTTSNGTPDISSSAVLVSGTQEHVIVSYDGVNVTMYRNGTEEVAEARTGGFNWDNTFKLILGDESTGGYDWLGQVQRVAIYDKVFNKVQVDNVFSGSPPGDGSNSVGATDWIER